MPQNKFTIALSTILAISLCSCINDSKGSGESSSSAQSSSNPSSSPIVGSSIVGSSITPSSSSVLTTPTSSSSNAATASCIDQGKKGYLRIDALNLCINSDSLRSYPWDGGIIIYNPAGFEYTLTRDGDDDDGYLHVGTYDASIYPYNALVEIKDLKDTSDCEFGTSCKYYYAVKGSWTITADTLTHAGSGTFSNLVGDDQQNCWEDTPVCGTPEAKGQSSCIVKARPACQYIANGEIKARWNF